MRLFGVPVRFQFSSLFLFWIFGMYGWNLTGTLFRSAGCIAIFLISLLTHEFMHVFVARRYGIPCHGITVMMLGAGAMLKDMGDRPGKMFAIAAAGPATSFVLAGAFLGIGAFGPFSGTAATVLAFGVMLNLILGIFNTIPMYPLDGGRLAHAVAWKLVGDEQRGRVIVVWLSRALIVGLLVWSAYTVFTRSE